MLHPSDIHYADLHFHTLYSDNRDRADLAAMARMGALRGLAWFGTGDHNHNLSAAKWEGQRTEMERTASDLPEFRFFQNCEYTFRLGHFLGLQPGKVQGTLKEAWRLLLFPSPAFLILNHPCLPTDDWKNRRPVHVRGVEVINGAVLRELREKNGGAFPRFTDLLDNPHIRCYAEYLARGQEVFPFGNSDAHTLEEIGLGVTGFFSGGETAGKPDDLAALAGKGLHFAAADAGLALKVSAGSSGAPGRTGGGATLEAEFTAGPSPVGLLDEEPVFSWYRGTSLVRQVRAGGPSDRGPEGWRHWRDTLELPSSGKQDRGLLWLGVTAGERFALSSPLMTERRRQRPGRNSVRLKRESSVSRRDPFAPEVWLFRRGETTGGDVLRWRRPPREFSLFSPSGRPEILTARGRSLVCGEDFLLSEPRTDVFIRKSAPPSALEECFLWLERNEVHEFKFWRLRRSFGGGCLRLEGLVVPGLSLSDSSGDRRIALAGEEILKLLPEIRETRLEVKTLPEYSCRLIQKLSYRDFPLEVRVPGEGFRSRILHPLPGRTVQLIDPAVES